MQYLKDRIRVKNETPLWAWTKKDRKEEKGKKERKKKKKKKKQNIKQQNKIK